MNNLNETIVEKQAKKLGWGVLELRLSEDILDLGHDDFFCIWTTLFVEIKAQAVSFRKKSSDPSCEWQQNQQDLHDFHETQFLIADCWGI